ncbi:MAG: hypothetical protein A2X49_02715 [Lentisphaerae bacterium GWF2_52_8]|nr:MAG: hypothetical protein A2X49_02715 [Lentisphaerae bacterium GWF2_52_8]
MKKKSILTVAMLAAASACVAGAESRIIFEEHFDFTGDKPLGFTEACSTSEAPPSLKALSFNPKDNKNSEVYKGTFMLPKGVPACKDYEFSFKFRFPRESKKAFTVSLLSGNAADKKSQKSDLITISEKGMNIRPSVQGLLPPFGGNEQELGIQFMCNNLWQDALIRVKGRTMELFVENDGEMRKFAQAETSGAPLLGFNFAGSSSFDLDDIIVRRLDAPPEASFRKEGGMKLANNAAEYKMDVPEGSTSAAMSFRLGTYPGVMLIKIGYEDASEKLIEVKTFGEKYAKDVPRQLAELDKDGKLVNNLKVVKENVNLVDAGLAFKERAAKDAKSSLDIKYYIRPRLQHRYEGARELQIVSNWEKFPAASQKFIRFELRPDEKGAQIWLDERYAGRFDSASKIKSISFVLPANAALKNEELSSKPFSDKFLPLDISKVANPGAMADAKVSLGGFLRSLFGGKSSGEQEISGIPFIVADGPGNADTGVCRENKGSFALECDGYLSRTPFDGMPESLMFPVPLAQYNKAWALCAVEDDPDKVTVITARLTKFIPRSEVGRGPAIADTAVTLPRLGEPLPEGVRKVGELSTGGKTLPLYLVEFKMDTGNIQEIIFQERPEWLDFEFLGKRYDKDNFYMDKSRKPSDDISGVHVFAATLERSPVEMQIMPTVFGNIYQPGEKPAMTATLRSVEKSSCKLEWCVRDLKGKELEKGAKEISFAKAGEESVVEIPFAQKDLGWYSVDYKLLGKDGSELLKHKAYFALIDSDKRKAGYDSPYFAWNFGGAHGTIKDINVSGPLLLKAGIRSTHVANEKVGEPWKLALKQLPRISPKAKDPQAAEKEIEDLIKGMLERFPHAQMALIFHESGGGPFPLEIVGGKTELDEKQAEYDKKKADHLEMIAKAYRKLAPQIKLVVGNSGNSNPGLLASLFRAKVPREYIDYLGEESIGATMPPELSVAQENWVMQEVARVFGYGEIPVCACYEWKCRRSRNLGLERFAEWNVRDILIGHAWKQPLIPTVALPDVGTSYYNTVWGDEAFTHNPQVYPKPGYPAVSTATQVLDCAKFERMVPTGSLTVYALEFKRGNEFIYAFWTARGELDATLDFEKDGNIRMTEMLGRSSDLKSSGGKLKLHIGEGAVYLTSPVALKAVSSLGERSFPREQAPADAKIFVASKMDKAEDWKLDMSVDPRIDVPAKAPISSYSFRRPGKYELRQVKDEKKGDCLELELIKEGDCPALMQEYTFLKLAKPLEIPGTPATVGLWVKGNSSWGKIFWELEDAEGEKWISAGTGGYGCNAYDWPEQAGINFDGWNFVQFPITDKSPVKVESPGQNGFQWQHNGTGNRKIDYPVKLTGLAISMPRQALDILKMEPVKASIRLGGLGAY